MTATESRQVEQLRDELVSLKSVHEAIRNLNQMLLVLRTLGVLVVAVCSGADASLLSPSLALSLPLSLSRGGYGGRGASVRRDGANQQQLGCDPRATQQCH